MTTIKQNNRFESDSVKERSLTIRRVLVELKDAGNPLEINPNSKSDMEALMNLDYTAIERLFQNEEQKRAIVHAINN